MDYLSTHNLTFHAIPVSLVIAAVPHWYAVGLYDRNRAPGTRRWDVSAPTEVIRNLKDAKLPPAIHAKFVRAEAAQNNGFTNVPLFCAAILACNYAGLSKRILYNIAYITCSKPRRGLIRTVIFNAGLINLCIMFIKAGNKIM